MGGRGLGSYSTKVPQPAWTQADLGAFSGTVACGYALRWTGCHWMACKRSGVRIPIAPLVGYRQNCRCCADRTAVVSMAAWCDIPVPSGGGDLILVWRGPGGAGVLAGLLARPG